MDECIDRDKSCTPCFESKGEVCWASFYNHIELRDGKLQLILETGPHGETTTPNLNLARVDWQRKYLGSYEAEPLRLRSNAAAQELDALTLTEEEASTHHLPCPRMQRPSHIILQGPRMATRQAERRV